MSYYPEFGRLVEEALMRLDRPPSWLAQRLGVNASTVSRWLNQGARPRDAETVVRVADVLGLNAQRQELLAAAGFGYSAGVSPEHRSDQAVLVPPNLPIPPTPFVGRTVQLARIYERLANPECRLLTIVGPGGIGKTRLAIRAAQEQMDEYAHGVCYVDLAPVERADLLAVTVLRALGAPDYGTAGPERRLTDFLHSKELLLLLDNFEHLLEGTDLLPRLLQASDGVKLLVTSRERLNLREEWLEPLEGLDLPPVDAVDAPGLLHEPLPDLGEYDSTRLFLMCVRRLQPDYVPSDGDAAAIISICRLLEGMPLGIELAAAWTRSLAPVEVQQEIANSLEFLATSLRDMPARHRSIRAVFDHSWLLLSEHERSILRQLSVFRGGCTREAAEEVTGASLADLAVLVDRSWVRRQASGRYGMHELIRQYCEEKLAAEHEDRTGEAPAEVRRRHCTFIGAAMRASLQKLNFEGAVYDEVIPELGNLQAAWRYAVENLDSEAGQKLALGIWFVGDVLGWFTFAVQTLEMGAVVLEEHIQQSGKNPEVVQRAAEVLVWIRLGQTDQNRDLGVLEVHKDSLDKLALAVECLGPGDAKLFWQAQLHMRCVWYAFDAGDFGEFSRLAHQAVELYEDPRLVDQLYGTPAGVTFWRAEAHFNLALALMHLGHYAAAEQMFKRSFALSDEIREGRWKGHRLSLHAKLKLVVGDLDRAEELVWEGLRLVQSFNDRMGTTRLHYALGCVLMATGRETEARKYLLESLGICRQCGYLWYHMESLNALGDLALLQNNIAEARERFEESMAVFKHAGTAHCISVPGALLGLGWTALAEEDLSEANTWFRKALATGKCAAWEKMEGIAGIAEVLAHEGDTAQAVTLLNLVAQHPFTAYDIRLQTQHRLSELENVTEQADFAGWLAAGNEFSLEEVVSEFASQFVT